MSKKVTAHIRFNGGYIVEVELIGWSCLTDLRVLLPQLDLVQSVSLYLPGRSFPSWTYTVAT